jgi:hypothetical protein
MDDTRIVRVGRRNHCVSSTMEFRVGPSERDVLPALGA